MAKHEYRISLSVINIYIKAVMTSITGYGVTAWACCLLLLKPRKMIRGVQRGILVRLDGALSTTQFEALTVVMNVVPLDNEIRCRAANYYLLIVRHEVRF